MADISWYLSRLRAMSGGEILWRIDQKRIEWAERKEFGERERTVIERVFYPGKEDLIFHAKRLPISVAETPSVTSVCGKEAESSFEDTNGQDPLDYGIFLPGGYSYKDYKRDWHAGFQTKNRWPKTFSPALSYKQRDEIGDARTNWELNRHFQFALLACRYYRSGEEAYLTELMSLFADWNRENPFLHGICWTSVMEVAIRDINWIYTLGFLRAAAKRRADEEKRSREQKDAADGTASERADKSAQSAHRTAGDKDLRSGLETLCRQLRIGILNMTSYIAQHYSRYSSANNHVIVEAAALGIAGLVTDCGEWYDTAFALLQGEIGRQNYADGVNKELSLHYQSFFMEAVGLLALTMRRCGLQMPQLWRNTLVCMSRYLSDCQGRYEETVVFGDDDEGKILDLAGICGIRGKQDHYRYVLELMSVALPERYVETLREETLLCLVPENIWEQIEEKPYYQNRRSVCYKEGGVSLLKSGDGRALIGIDHGALGFGSIAAHGHADALSFQMFLEGEAVFADAGTYLYHIDLENRNAFRKTENHNTMTVGGRDQSEMLGAFLWGKRAQTRLLACNLPIGNAGDKAEERSDGDNEKTEGGRRREDKEPALWYVEAEHDGYAPLIHRRRYEFDGARSLTIRDELLGVEQETEFCVNFLLGADCKAAEKADGGYEIVTRNGSSIMLYPQSENVRFKSEIVDTNISESYGIMRTTKKIRLSGAAKKDMALKVKIQWTEA